MTSACVFVSWKGHYNVDFWESDCKEIFTFWHHEELKVNFDFQHLIGHFLSVSPDFLALQFFTCNSSDI